MTNFREFTLSSGKVIKAGKDSEQNDELVSISKREDTLLHTVEPGSPFCNLGASPSKEEIKESAIFCALKSQDWRDHHSNVKVHVFKKSDCYKEKSMKSGTWGVKNFSETINVKKMEILNLEKEMSNHI